jgi:hypothetical protein
LFNLLINAPRTASASTAALTFSPIRPVCVCATPMRTTPSLFAPTVEFSRAAPPPLIELLLLSSASFALPADAVMAGMPYNSRMSFT